MIYSQNSDRSDRSVIGFPKIDHRCNTCYTRGCVDSVIEVTAFSTSYTGRRNPLYICIYKRISKYDHFDHHCGSKPAFTNTEGSDQTSSFRSPHDHYDHRKGGANSMDYYIRYFYEYAEEHESEADRIVDYLSDYLVRQEEINRDINTKDIRQHCENCLEIIIPHNVFLGALIYCRYQLSIIGQDVFANISDRSPILMIRSGKPFSRRSPEICQIVRYYGQRGLDSALFNKRSRGTDVSPEAS